MSVYVSKTDSQKATLKEAYVDPWELALEDEGCLLNVYDFYVGLET